MKKKILFTKGIAIIFILLSGYPLFAQPDCNKQEPGGCPFKFGTLSLDKCTPAIGNTLCTAFNNADAILDKLNNGAGKFKDEAEQKLKGYLSQTFKDALDAQALQDFNQAAKFYNEIYNELMGMIKDENCGPNQIKNIQRFFITQFNNLASIKNIMESGFRVISTDVPPALQNIAEFSTELSNAIQISSGQGQKGLEDLKKIQNAVNTLNRQIEMIKNFDAAGIVISTTDLTVQVGSLYGKCSVCAGAIVTTIGEVQKSFAEGGTAAATPETWEAAGGSAWLAPFAGLDGAIGAIGTLASPVACGPMIEAIDKINKYIEALKAYYKKINLIASNIKESVIIIEDAADNLSKLVASASKELKHSIEKMSKSLAALDKHVDNLFEGINKKVLPKVQDITIMITKQVAANAGHLYDCYEEYIGLTERVTSETITGIKDMFEAGSKIVDAAKIMDNMGSGVTNTMNAARNKAGAEYNDIKESFSNLEKSLCISTKSNGTINLEGTAECIINKVFKNGPEAYLNDAKAILKHSGDLISAVTDLAAKAARAADDAYTSKPGTAKKIRAIAKSKEAREKAESALVKIKRSTIKEFAKNKAKEESKRKMKEQLEQAKNNKEEIPDSKLTERKKLSPIIISQGN